MRGFGNWWIWMGAAVVFTGASAVSRAGEVATITQPLLGPVSQSDDCTPEMQRFNDEIMVYGRATAATRAFEQCVDQDVRALYRKCKGDPFYDSSVSTQIAQVLAASRSPGGVQIRCTGGSGNASTGLGWYGNPGEGFNWGGWFSSVLGQLGRPLCTAGQDPDTNNCRYAAMPWPYSQAAGIVWHEVMHTQGYSHGANAQADAIKNCGYAGDATWNFQTNTMPYILGNCVTKVIARSGEKCGDLRNCNSSHQVRLLTSYDGTTCTCVNDPGKKGLAILTVRNNKLIDRAMLPEEDWIGGWHYGRTNAIRTTGDFDGDGLADFVVTSDWGMGVLTREGDGWRPLVVQPNGTRLGGWNLNANGDQMIGVGDFDGDRRGDLVVRSGWGIGILKLAGASLTHVMMAPHATRFGGWNFGTGDVIRGIGDFNGDGKADLLITSGWGIAILTVSGSSLTPLMVAPSGTRFGGWNYNAGGDMIRGIADFDGDGKDDVLITSGWGIGALALRDGTLRDVMMAPSGANFGGWNYNAQTDRIVGIGDFDGNKRADIVIRSNWGMALLTRSNASLGRLSSQQGGVWIDGWNFNAVSDVVSVAGDLDGDGRDDLLLRSGWGMGVVRRDPAGPLRLIDAQPNGGLFGSWSIAGTDKIAGRDHFIGIDRLAATRRDGLLMQR